MEGLDWCGPDEKADSEIGASMTSVMLPPRVRRRPRQRSNVRLGIWWSSKLARNKSRSRIQSALRSRNVSGSLVNIPRGKRLFVFIFRVGIGALMARKVSSGLC